jgi:hypothetical protein
VLARAHEQAIARPLQVVDLAIGLNWRRQGVDHRLLLLGRGGAEPYGVRIMSAADGHAVLTSSFHDISETSKPSMPAARQRVAHLARRRR